MSLMIYKPRKYSGFGMTESTDSNCKVYANNTPVPDPYDGENVVVEVACFTGSKTQYYADTGECTFTVDSAAVSPQHIKSGYLVECDGSIYRIETYRWEQTESGYTCTFGGRGIESLYDDAVFDYMLESGYSYFDRSMQERVTLESINKLWLHSYGDYALRYRASEPRAMPRLLPITSNASPLRMIDYSASYNEIEYETDAMVNGAGKDTVIDSGLSIGAILRTWLSWLGCGYKVVRKSYSASMPHQFYRLVLYNQDPSNVIDIFVDGERGISEFAYEYDKRDAVNQVLYSYATKYPCIQKINSDKATNNVDFRNWGNLPTSAKYRSCAAIMRGSGSSSFTDYAMQGASKYIDLGEIPDKTDDNSGTDMHDGSLSAAHNWVNAQMSTDDLTSPTEQVTFTYDNGGRYKYGTDFFLGSTVRVINEALGITATQMLTKVTTNYAAGDAVSYGFEFGNQRVTQADKLKSKFAIIDKRTYKQ